MIAFDGQKHIKTLADCGRNHDVDVTDAGEFGNLVTNRELQRGKLSSGSHEKIGFWTIFTFVSQIGLFLIT